MSTVNRESSSHGIQADWSLEHSWLRGDRLVLRAGDQIISTVACKTMNEPKGFFGFLSKIRNWEINNEVLGGGLHTLKLTLSDGEHEIYVKGNVKKLVKELKLQKACTQALIKANSTLLQSPTLIKTVRAVFTAATEKLNSKEREARNSEGGIDLELEVEDLANPLKVHLDLEKRRPLSLVRSTVKGDRDWAQEMTKLTADLEEGKSITIGGVVFTKSQSRMVESRPNGSEEEERASESQTPEVQTPPIEQPPGVQETESAVKTSMDRAREHYAKEINELNPGQFLAVSGFSFAKDEKGSVEGKPSNLFQIFIEKYPKEVGNLLKMGSFTRERGCVMQLEGDKLWLTGSTKQEFYKKNNS